MSRSYSYVAATAMPNAAAMIKTPTAQVISSQFHHYILRGITPVLQGIIFLRATQLGS